MTLIQLLKSGASMRYRPPHGFYTVMSGKSTPLSEATGRAAVQSGVVRPAGKDPHGVYLFTLNNKAANVRRVPDPAQALPKRPAAAPNALPDVHPLRGTLHSEIPAAVPADNRTAQGQVQGGAGGLDGAGAQRERVAGAGQGGCMGCGACAGKGVTA